MDIKIVKKLDLVILVLESINPIMERDGTSRYESINYCNNI